MKNYPSQNIKSTDEFDLFLNCATLAISKAFKLEHHIIVMLLNALGINNHIIGLTHSECVKLINIIAKSHKNYSAKYIPNKGKITYNQLAFTIQDEILIVSLPEHLSLLDNGIILDNYYSNDRFNEFYKVTPVGWWKLKTITKKH